MDLTDSLKALFIDTAKTLKGSARRVFMARTVKELGLGGQRRAERELGWSRVLIRKGTRELESGIPIQDNFSARGRKRAEDHLPHLLTDIQGIVVKAEIRCPQNAGFKCPLIDGLRVRSLPVLDSPQRLLRSRLSSCLLPPLPAASSALLFLIRNPRPLFHS